MDISYIEVKGLGFEQLKVCGQVKGLGIRCSLRVVLSWLSDSYRDAAMSGCRYVHMLY